MSVMGLTQDFGHSVLVELPRIALTKTVPPAVRKFAVQRPKLMRFLDGAAMRRLILFKAPAGYGKTTLAAEWSQRLRQAGLLVAWLSLDTDDNEPGAFAYHLARSLESASPALGRDAIELLRASSLIPARNVISSLLNSVSEARFRDLPVPRRFPRACRSALPRADDAPCALCAVELAFGTRIARRAALLAVAPAAR